MFFCSSENFNQIIFQSKYVSNENIYGVTTNLLIYPSFHLFAGHRFEDNPGVRRHLVKKSSRCQVTQANNGSPSLSSLKKRKKMDKKTHEVRLYITHEDAELNGSPVQ